MTEILKIPYPATPAGKKQWTKLYGLNAYYVGKHWSKRKEDAQYWHMLTLRAMQGTHCRKKPFEKPVVITFLFNDSLDCSNHAMIAKMIEDGLKGRLIVDDTRRWVKGIEMYFHSADYIKVIIREVDNDNT